MYAQIRDTKFAISEHCEVQDQVFTVQASLVRLHFNTFCFKSVSCSEENKRASLFFTWFFSLRPDCLPIFSGLEQCPKVWVFFPIEHMQYISPTSTPPIRRMPHEMLTG